MSGTVFHRPVLSRSHSTFMLSFYSNRVGQFPRKLFSQPYTCSTCFLFSFPLTGLIDDRISPYLFPFLFPFFFLASNYNEYLIFYYASRSFLLQFSLNLSLKNIRVKMFWVWLLIRCRRIYSYTVKRTDSTRMKNRV